MVDVLNQIGRPAEAAAAYRKAVRAVGSR
ncbi:MAG: hypothetical protein ABW215_09250 [Kibdelosporangium sp.]